MVRLMSTQETISEDSLRWQAVLVRDARFDGVFVYAVRSTGIYCRPSCPSRRPRSDNVRLFNDPAAAEQQGFRACLRCRPTQDMQGSLEASQVIAACRYLQTLEDSNVAASDLSAHVDTSPARLARAFRKVLGVTPWQYADALQLERFKSGLRKGASVTVTDALYEAGYSSPSRLYERADRLLGMTPRAYRDGGKGMYITYGTVPCIAGRMLVAATAKGVCFVRLGDTDAELEQALGDLFPAADIARGDAAFHQRVEQIAGLLEAPAQAIDVPLDIQATAFQRCVWEALRDIPYGESRTYGAVAQAIGRPSAVRAVARACASNPAAVVVPCHRVVPASGGTGGYRWGAERKAAMLEHERRNSPSRLT
ncbi:MAG: bifunctional DNA-binding transcriptional regulator/O6-methylguanine-DNA methyltransferase Ada [Dehalococcoidia bacterium]